MKKKILAALCILGIPFFCLGINWILRRNHFQERGAEKAAAQENMEFTEGNLPGWKVIVLNPGSYRAVILKYPALQTTSQQP